MRPKAFLGVALVLATLMSCSDQLPSQEETVATDCSGIRLTVPDTTQFVTPSRALDVAARYSLLSPSRSAATEVESVETVLDSAGQAAAYVINYADKGGFIIVSASKGYYPILAQSDEGAFHVSDITDSHPASLWLGEQKSYIRYSQSLPDSVRQQIASEWMRYNPEIAYLPASSRSEDYPDKPQVFYDSLRRWTMDPKIQVYRYDDFLLTPEYSRLSEDEKRQIVNGIHIYGNSNYGTPESSSLILIHDQSTIESYHLIDTKWDQMFDFNDSNPEGPVLGCTTVAAGQIMRFHRHPSSYEGKIINWDDMPSAYATKTTSDFLYKLAKRIGVDFMTGGADINQVENALSAYKYECDIKPHTLDFVRSELRKQKPVYMCGVSPDLNAGHAWVCDGERLSTNRNSLRVMTLDYRPTSYSTPDLMVEAYAKDLSLSSAVFLYYNWGWRGDQNAFYVHNSFQVKVKGVWTTFSNDRKDMSIHPIK